MLLACSGLFSWIEKNATVVTPSRLLAGVARQQFISRKLAAGEGCWQQPKVMSIGAWLANSWQEARYSCLDLPSLLSTAQEHVLWKRIIEDEASDLFDVDAIARLASRAAKTLAEWEIPSEGSHWNESGDALQFQSWLKLFRDVCLQQGWATRADLWQLLPKAIVKRHCATDAKIVFPGDGTLFPAFARMLKAFEDRATVSAWLQKAPRNLAPAKSFDDFSSELEFVARRTRQSYEQNSSQSIGVFVPDLAKHRTSVERAFLDVFYPGACRAIVDEWVDEMLIAPKVFNLNAEGPLSSTPLVAGALLLVQLAYPHISIADAGAILRSPFLTGASIERGARALADIEIRKRRELDVTLDDLAVASARCPRLATTWPKVRLLVERRKVIDTFAGWSRFIGDLLGAVGWPGDAELGSREQDTIEAWKNSLSQLSSLSLVSGPVTLDVAMGELQRMLQDGFEEGSLSSPIQIVDAAKATGLQFDSALLAGLSEQFWPPSLFGSPLVPLKLQVEHRIVGSSPQNLREERERITFALFSAAPQMSVTYSGRLSPLAERYVRLDAAGSNVWSGKTAWQSFKPTLLEESNDGQAPPFESNASTKGGTSIIKAQSLCPFRAFAEFRLQGRSPDEGCLGLDARERGGNLHKALELVWRQLRTWDRLRATQPAELRSIVEIAIEQALSTNGSSSFNQIVTSVEAERLKTVILDWLSIERERQQPFTVETVEEEQYLDLAGLQLRLRLDRIDRLANGQVLLIDYKSGEQRRKKLESPRPEEPQLLVYAAGLRSQVDGVLFAQLKARDVRPVGFTRERHFKSKTVDVEGLAWDTFLETSSTEVEQLAEQFKSGYAALDPLNGACDYCAQKPLCRITENRRLEETEE